MEPWQAGPRSPRMTGRFCDLPAAQAVIRGRPTAIFAVPRAGDWAGDWAGD